jgi:hypothetical protein
MSYVEALTPVRKKKQAFPLPLRACTDDPFHVESAPQTAEDITLDSFVTFRPQSGHYTKALYYLNPGQVGRVVGSNGNAFSVQFEGCPGPVEVDACDLEAQLDKEVPFSFLAEVLQEHAEKSLSKSFTANQSKTTLEGPPSQGAAIPWQDSFASDLSADTFCVVSTKEHS